MYTVSVSSRLLPELLGRGPADRQSQQSFVAHRIDGQDIR